MSTFIGLLLVALILLLFIGVVGAKKGWFKDTDGDDIPDFIEEPIKKAKKKVKSKLKKK